MRMLIASDLHGSTESLEFLLQKVEELHPDHVVLLGDLLYHGPRNCLPKFYAPKGMPDNFARLMERTQVIAVRGNCDAEVDLFVLPFPMPDSAWIVDGPRQIYVSHGHRIPENPPMAGFEPGTIFLRGHTHVPRAEYAGGFYFWNPGSITLPKQGYPRSYAVLDNGTFTILSMDGSVLAEQEAGAAQ